MIYNYGITLNNDGTGVSFLWNNDQNGFQKSEDKKNTFWIFPEPLYKSKREDKKEGFITRFLNKIKV